MANNSAKILIRMFTQLALNCGDGIHYLERILQSMCNASYLKVHHLVAKCLLLSDANISDILQKKLLSGEIDRNFGGFFNRYVTSLSFENAIAQSEIRELYCSELFDGIGDITLPLNVSNEASHHENHMDMMFVVAIASYLAAKNIFEFGTYMGRTTCGFAALADDITVFTLNLPPETDERYGPYIGQLIKTSPYKNRIQQIYSDSFNFSPEAYAKKMDFIFIDADHSYEAVKNDTEKAFQMLNTGGAIVWHDFAPKSSGVVKYLCELSTVKSLFKIRNTCLVVYLDTVDAVSFVPKVKALFLEDVNF